MNSEKCLSLVNHQFTINYRQTISSIFIEDANGILGQDDNYHIAEHKIILYFLR